MGVVGAVVGTLALGYLNGRAQQNQYEAMAAQADANRQIAEENARKADEAAKTQDQNNKINEENENRKRQRLLGAQRNAIGGSGVTSTGSALMALQDSYQEMKTESAIQSNNNRQKVQSLFDQSTEYTNNALSYKRQSDSYNDAASSAKTNAMLGAAFGLASQTSLAPSLYSGKSAAKATTSSYQYWGAGYDKG